MQQDLSKNDMGDNGVKLVSNYLKKPTIGDDEAATDGKVNTTTMQTRNYLDSDYCKGKRVTCIKFHPMRPYIVAMSMIDNMDFDTRAMVQGKSFDSQLLVLNFEDSDIISLKYTCMHASFYLNRK